MRSVTDLQPALPEPATDVLSSQAVTISFLGNGSRFLANNKRLQLKPLVFKTESAQAQSLELTFAHWNDGSRGGVKH